MKTSSTKSVEEERQWPSVAGQRPPQVTSLDSRVGGLTNVRKRKKEPELIPFYLSRTSVMVSRPGRHLSMEEPGWGRPSGTQSSWGVVGEASAVHCT